MGYLKQLMAIYNKKNLAKSINQNETRVYRFVSGDDEQLGNEDIANLIKQIEATSKKAVSELQTIRENKNKEL